MIWPVIFPSRSRGYRGPDRRSPLTVGVDGGYRGPDRRSANSAPATQFHAWVLVAVALGGSIVVALGATTSLRALAAFVLLRALADAMLLLAGGAQLLNWRITGRAAPALTGAAFVVVGGLMLPLWAPGFLLHDDPVLQHVAPSCTVVLGACGAYLCIRATRLRSVVATLRPLLEGSVLALAAVFALAVIGVIRTRVGSVDRMWPWSAELGLVAIAWLVAAAGYLRRSAPDGLDRSLALVVAGLGVADGILAVSFGDHLTVAASAMVVQAVAAAGALIVSSRGLERVLGRQGSGTLRLAGELGDAVRVLAEEQATRQRLLHDARSTLSAVRLANGTLTRYQEQLDGMLQEELRQAVSTELVRLEQMLTHDHGRDRIVFNVADALLPVIRVFRDAGLEVAAELRDAPVAFGRPTDTATVVHALLTNAATYAGDGPVEVSARMSSTGVQIEVADRGPGVPESEREEIFRRGVRGRHANGREGSGLGLFIGRWLMDEQEGSLRVADRPGGGARFLATLPVPSAARPPESTGPGATRQETRDLSGVSGVR